MSTSIPITAERANVTVRDIVAAYFNLTKPRIMTLLLITTLASLLIAVREHPLAPGVFVRVLCATMLGGAMASGGAAALNCYIDRDIDAVMNRTRCRALPTGVVQARHVLVYGVGLSVAAAIVMFLFVNPLAMIFAVFGNLFYVVVYTMWLKRSTTQNIVIGGAAGAIPPVVGWAAVTSGVAWPAVLLFVIIFAWTPAHFWSLALLNRKDYSAAGVPMLPSVVGERKTKRQILVYTILVVGSTLALYAIHAMGPFYLAAALALGGGFIYMAVTLLRDGGIRFARRTFLYSNLYLALLFFSMVIDRALPWS